MGGENCYLYKFLSSESEYFLATISDYRNDNRYWFSNFSSLNDSAELAVQFSDVGDEKEELNVKSEVFAEILDSPSLFDAYIYYLSLILPPNFRDFSPEFWKEKLRENQLSPNLFFETNRFQSDFYWRLRSEKIGILSLTREWSQPAMWAHYSNNRAGVCLKFELLPDFFQAGMPQLSEVLYCEKAPMVRYWGVFLSELKRLIGAKNVFAPQDELWKMTCAKRRSWSYENEVRAVSWHGTGHQTVPYLRLHSVIFGEHSSQETYDRVLPILGGLPTFKCFTDRKTGLLRNALSTQAEWQNYSFADLPTSDD